MFLSHFIFSEDKIMCSDKHYLDIYTKLIDKWDNEIIEEDFAKGIPFCTNIQYDEIVVDEVIKRYKQIERSNNRLLYKRLSW